MSHKVGILKVLAEFASENRLVPKSVLSLLKRHRREFLLSLVQPGGVCAEIGVQKGFFTHVILEFTRPARLHLIDPWYLLGEKWTWAAASRSTTKALRNIIYWFQKELASGSVVLQIGFDQEILRNLPDGYFDWVYLDTSHSYEDTRDELELLDKKIKAQGIIVGDDWFSDPAHHFYGQYLAVDEFVKSHGYEIAALDEANHQWAIRKRSAPA